MINILIIFKARFFTMLKKYVINIDEMYILFRILKLNGNRKISYYIQRYLLIIILFLNVYLFFFLLY